MKREGLTVAVILLFIGVAVSPSIYADNVSKPDEEEYVELTTEFCGMKGCEPYKVTLSIQEAHEFRCFIDSVEQQLDRCESTDEVLLIYNQTIDELRNYDLLSETDAIKLKKTVMKRMVGQKAITEILGNSNEQVELLNATKNFLCLLMGTTVGTGFWSQFQIFLFGTFYLILIFLYYYKPYLIYNLLNIIDFLYNIKPLSYADMIYFQGEWDNTYHDYIDTGWIHSTGLNGIKKWNAPFAGNAKETLDDTFKMLSEFYHWRRLFQAVAGIGVIGFTGIKIVLDENNKEYFYLGEATYISIIEIPE